MLLLLISGCSGKSVSSRESAYDQLVLSASPVLFLAMDTPGRAQQRDLTRNGHTGTYLPAGSRPRTALMPNSDVAADFNGRNQYLQVANSPDLSVPKTGVLTIEAWIRPDTLQPPRQEGTGYVNFLGKSEHGGNNSEYEMRLYSKVNREVPMRPDRLSVYVFNLAGGKGSGSYVQDPMTAGQWIMVTEVINTTASAKYPLGYCSIYKNGVRRQTVGLTQYHTTPGHGNAPFRVGSCDPRPPYSFFPGAIGKVAVFDYELSPAQVMTEYTAMTR